MENNIETKKEFAAMMYGIAGIFGGKINKYDLKLRFELLKKYTLDDIKNAGIWILKNREKTFPAVPTLKEFIDAIEKIINPQLSLKAQAENQCDIVLKYFGRDGSACQHVFKNSSTKYLMSNRWGFKQIGEMKPEDIKWFRKSFVEAWVDLEEYGEKLKQQIEYTGPGRIPVEDLSQLLLTPKSEEED